MYCKDTKKQVHVKVYVGNILPVNQHVASIYVEKIVVVFEGIVYPFIFVSLRKYKGAIL
jgi:hypothetical protein